MKLKFPIHFPSPTPRTFSSSELDRPTDGPPQLPPFTLFLVFIKILHTHSFHVCLFYTSTCTSPAKITALCYLRFQKVNSNQQLLRRNSLISTRETQRRGNFWSISALNQLYRWDKLQLLIFLSSFFFFLMILNYYMTVGLLLKLPFNTTFNQQFQLNSSHHSKWILIILF